MCNSSQSIKSGVYQILNSVTKKMYIGSSKVAMIGKKRPDLAERNKANKGKIISDITKLNMAKAQLGRKHSLETKAKISISNKGKLKSKEHKEKLATATKEYFKLKRLAKCSQL